MEMHENGAGVPSDGVGVPAALAPQETFENIMEIDEQCGEVHENCANVFPSNCLPPSYLNVSQI